MKSKLSVNSSVVAVRIVTSIPSETSGLLARGPRSDLPARTNVQSALLHGRRDIQSCVFAQSSLHRFGDVIQTDHALRRPHLETTSAARLRTFRPRSYQPFKHQMLRFALKKKEKKNILNLNTDLFTLFLEINCLD